MSQSASPSTGKVYGVERVCSAWGVPRSSFYNKHSSKPRADEEPPPKKKRGPKPKISDVELLELIKQDIEESPFIGEGHRKIWARLYYVKKIKVAKKRVLAIMRENNLLSPHRSPQKPPREHDGRITTDEPNVMWGTDGAKVFTLEEGWGWIFINVEHWNAEVLGWHVCKKGNRFAALEPISQGVLNQTSPQQELCFADSPRRITTIPEIKPQHVVVSWGLKNDQQGNRTLQDFSVLTTETVVPREARKPSSGASSGL